MNRRKYQRVIEFARLYYEEKKTQEEIAAMFNISRSSVSRGLKLAEDIGAVQVRVINPFSNFFELGEALKARFGLEHVVIAPAVDQSYEVRRREIGYAAASFFETILSVDAVVGVTWGSTVAEMAFALQPQENINAKFVQMLGAGGHVVAPAHVNEITRRIAEAFRSDWFLFPAPAVVENEAIKNVLVKEESVAAVLDMCRRADVALVGIGTPDHRSGAVNLGHISLDEMKTVAVRGAVGEICYRFFDIEGKPCETDLEKRVLGIGLEELRSIPTRIGIAGGEHKVSAILGALRGQYVNVLVTDEITARCLL